MLSYDSPYPLESADLPIKHCTCALDQTPSFPFGQLFHFYSIPPFHMCSLSTTWTPCCAVYSPMCTMPSTPLHRRQPPHTPQSLYLASSCIWDCFELMALCRPLSLLSGSRFHSCRSNTQQATSSGVRRSGVLIGYLDGNEEAYRRLREMRGCQHIGLIKQQFPLPSPFYFFTS
jgi:hypothetical protein